MANILKNLFSLFKGGNHNTHHENFESESQIPNRIQELSFEEALKIGMELEQEGSVLKNNVEFELALEYYDLSIQKNPNNYLGFAFRAFCLQGLGYFLDSIEDFNKAISLNPDNPNLYFGRGKSLFVLQNYQPAIEDLEKAIYYINMNNPAYEAYNEDSKATGYSSAVNMYETEMIHWKKAKVLYSNDTLEKIHKDAIANNDQELIKLHNERQSFKESLMKRRNK